MSLASNTPWLILSLALCLGTVGCAPAPAPRATTDLVLLPLSPGATLGQTLVARHAGLVSIVIYLVPDAPGDGAVRLRLLSGPQDSREGVVATLPVRAIGAPGFYAFGFPPQADSNQREYYFTLDIAGEGWVRVGTTTGDAYLDGALYRDAEPLDAQMSFELVYSRRWMLWELLGETFSWLGILIVVFFLFVMPGWVLLAFMWSGWDDLGWAVKLGLACGLSLALYPLLFLWTDLFGLRLGLLYAWLPALAALAILIIRSVQVARRASQATDSGRASTWVTHHASRFTLHDLTLVIVIALVFGVRFWAIRSLDAPMWGDSYQHTMIAQLIVDHGGLFDSWEPYAPYRTFTVQFGFSIATALFSWLTGLDSVRATLWVGQIMNGLAALTLYPLSVRLAGGNRWAGVGAILIGGLLSPMPAMYVNWGRYAQLAGQVILPVALWLLLQPLEAKQFRGRQVLLAGAVLAGMSLTYYRMPFYYATFVLAWLVGWGLPQWRRNVRRWLHSLMVLVPIGVIALALLLPWGLRVSGGQLSNAVKSGVTLGTPLESVLADYRIWSDVGHYVPGFLQIVFAAGLIWSIVRRRWAVAAMSLWITGLVLVIAARLIRLPGANMMQSHAILIALYIPVSLVGGWLIGYIAEWIERRAFTAGRVVLAIAIIGLALWGSWNQRLIEQPQTFAIVNRPDLRAMSWIRARIPTDARFLVEGFRIYEGFSAVGADAGWWIPLLAGRANTMPPQYALLNETPSLPDYTRQVVDLVAHLETTFPGSPDGIRLLCDQGITHVYIGQGQGKIGAGAVQLFSPDKFTDSNTFDLVYHADRVYIFALNPQACEASR